MGESETTYFEHLKSALAHKFRQQHPEAPADIREWKGQDIVNFQEALMERVQGRVSEKWFYTHIKHDSARLPRIDVRDMLSRYIGMESWQHFVYQQSQQVSPPAKPFFDAPKGRYWRYPVWGGLGLVGIWLLLSAWPPAIDRPPYQVCFLDADHNQALREQPVELWVLSESESPKRFTGDETGCVSIPGLKGKVSFAVRAPYYHVDTFTRYLGQQKGPEYLTLRTDDYALMIHYFSQAKGEDWQKRRQQLKEIFDPGVRIFQVQAGTERGMEMYNKEEFINKMTMPLQSLKQIEVIETQYRNGRIVSMRFIQKKGGWP